MKFENYFLILTTFCGGEHRSKSQNKELMHRYSSLWKTERPLDSLGQISKSQDKEDLWLWENFFYGVENGTIVESGCVDGDRFSNTLFYEKFANWRTIHIEADPDNFEKLKENRNQSINVHSALCNENKLLHWSGNLAGPATRGIIEFMSNSFTNKYLPSLNVNGEDREKILKSLQKIPCVKFTDIMNSLYIKKIDIFILDVEGAELSVLKGMNNVLLFDNSTEVPTNDRIHIDVLMMECDGQKIDNIKMNLVEKSGMYECRVYLRNCICKHHDFQPSSKKKKSILVAQRVFVNQPWEEIHSRKVT